MINNDNNINYSEPFRYPMEEDDVEENTHDTNDIVVRMSQLLFASKAPKVTLAALLYSCGMDVGIYLGSENNITHIAKSLGISKQRFSKSINDVRQQLNIKYADTGKSSLSKDTYSKSNSRNDKSNK